MNDLFFSINTPYLPAYRNDSPAFPVGPHAHDGIEVYLTLTDLPDVLIGDHIYAAKAGTLIFIPPFCVHQLYHEADRSYERYVLNIQKKWISDVFFFPSAEFPCLETNDRPLLIRIDEAEKKKLQKQFQKLLSFDDPTKTGALACFFELMDMFIRLADKSPSAAADISASQRKVNEIISYIEEHISESITISDLSGHFFLNGDYLARLFKKHAHVSLGHYIILQKISVSQKMLREGCSIENVAEALNFSNYAHFFKTFQKITGMSPGRYRKLYRDRS